MLPVLGYHMGTDFSELKAVLDDDASKDGIRVLESAGQGDVLIARCGPCGRDSAADRDRQCAADHDQAIGAPAAPYHQPIERDLR